MRTGRHLIHHVHVQVLGPFEAFWFQGLLVSISAIPQRSVAPAQAMPAPTNADGLREPCGCR